MICPTCGQPTGEKRSEQSHRLFRVWNRIIAQECGYSEEEMICIFFEELGYGETVKAVNPFSGEIREKFRRRSTRTLTKEEMKALMDLMDRIGAEHEYRLPRAA